MSLAAIIPVREGSTRIKNKNSRTFASKNLLQIKIEQLKRISSIDEIIVSTDSDLMIDIAVSNGVSYRKRPKEYCDEKSKSFNQVVNYIASNEINTEDIIWAPCVCPLLKDESIIKGILNYTNIKKGNIIADSVISASLIKEYIFDEKGPVNFSVNKHVPSQLLPNWHVVHNGFFIAARLNMVKWGFVYGPNPFIVEISKEESIDIDDMYDFKIAEYLYNSNIKEKF